METRVPSRITVNAWGFSELVFPDPLGQRSIVTRKNSTKSDRDDRPERQKRIGWAQLIVFALLLVGAGALWQSRDHVSDVLAQVSGTEQSAELETASERKVPVVVTRVSHTSNESVVGAIGTGRARRSVTLFPDATGEIVEFAVRSGEEVVKGDLIMALDRRAAELAVRVANTQVIEAERLLQRAEQLRERNIHSQAKVDDAKNLHARAELELEQAQEALEDRKIVAPFDGIVGIAKVELGDRVTPTTEIVTLDDRSEILVEFDVPEEFLARIEVGQAITARTPTFADRAFDGTVEKIDSRLDPVSRTVMVRATLPNREDLLRPGMSFVVELKIPGKTYPTVPELALQWEKGKSYVWRVRDGKVEQVDARSIRRVGSTILIEGDVAEGDIVVVEGVQRLRPGRPVAFSMPDPPPSS